MGAFTANGSTFTMLVMNRRSEVKLPLFIFSGSLIFIITIMLLANPVDNIIFVVLFFLLLFVCLIALSLFFINLQTTGYKRTAAIRNAVIISTVAILLIMLRSAGALNLIDLGLMLLFFGGLGFYLGKRQK
jgi:hypothetical protein